MSQQINIVKISIAITGMLFVLPCAAQVSLVRNGEARAVVITANDPSETAHYAVKELVLHLKDATGVTLKVLPESETPEAPHTRVYIGETEAARHLGMDPERLQREAYTMRSVGNDLFIIGRDSDEDPLREGNPDVGTLFGVYDFLQLYLGVRWLWPGEPTLAVVFGQLFWACTVQVTHSSAATGIARFPVGISCPFQVRSIPLDSLAEHGRG